MSYDPLYHMVFGDHALLLLLKLYIKLENLHSSGKNLWSTNFFLKKRKQEKQTTTATANK